MAMQLINLGTTVNDGTGDALRVGAQKINENFTELYSFISDATGEPTLVSSIIPGDGIATSSTSGNIFLSAKMATPTELGVVKVGAGLEISLGGTLSTQFTGQYNELVGAPVIPSSLTDFGINPGTPGQVLMSTMSGAEFSELYNQTLNTTDNVLFSSIVTDTTLTFNTTTTETENLILNYTGQRDNLINSVIPGLEAQRDSYQQQYNTWVSILNSTMPGSPEYNNAQNQVMMFSNLLNQTTSQISMVQGQVSSLTSTIGYLQSILGSTSTTVRFDHSTQSIVFNSAITTPLINLENSNQIVSSAETGVSVESSSDVTVSAAAKNWVFGLDGNLVLPTNGDIVNSLGESIIAAAFDQQLNTTNDVTFNSVSVSEIVSTGTGIPTFTSATNINLEAANAVIVTTSPLRLANLTEAQRDALVPVNGDMIYNTTTNKLQGYQNGSWINLDGTV